MIITRSPLRISLGGGGTDLPSYYREHGGFLIAGAIDKYVYIALHETFVPEIIVRYSKMEVVASAGEIQHPIVREALRLIPIEDPHILLPRARRLPDCRRHRQVRVHRAPRDFRAGDHRPLFQDGSRGARCT